MGAHLLVKNFKTGCKYEKVQFTCDVHKTYNKMGMVFNLFIKETLYVFTSSNL